MWMASSLDSLEAGGVARETGEFGDPLCMSVKADSEGIGVREFVVRAIAMSSKLSQPNVGGMSTPEKI